MYGNNYQILALRDQAKYDPQNIDVLEYYREANAECHNNLNVIDSTYKAWFDCFYQYRTPIVNFQGNTNYFANWEATKAMFYDFPRLFNPDFDPYVASVMYGTMKSGAQERQDSYVLLRDQYMNRCIYKFFGRGGKITSGGKEADAKSVQLLAAVKAEQVPHYESWVTQWKTAQFNAQKARLTGSIGNNYGKWLGLAAGVATAIFFPPAGVPALASLGTFLYSAKDDVNKLIQGQEEPALVNFDPNEQRARINTSATVIPGAGPINNPNSPNPNAAGIGNNTAVLLLAGAALIMAMSKK